MFKKQKTNLNIVKELAITDLKLRYQGSVGGYLWTLMKPLFLFTVLYIVFTKFLRIGSNIPFYAIYLLLGVVIWSFFAEVTSVCIGSIVGKGELIRKIYFPRILLVIANSLTSFIVFLLNLVIVFCFMLFLKVPLTANFLYFPLLILELYILVLGVSLLLSALYVRFRDIAPIWEVFLQAMFYATPILYPLSLVPQNIAKIMCLSPITQIIQGSRYVLVSNQTLTVNNFLSLPWILIPYILPIFMLILGYFVFNRMSAKFAEEI